MKKFAMFIITAVLTAISTILALDAIGANAEAEAAIEATSMAELVYALRAGAVRVEYSDEFMYIAYDYNVGMSQKEFDYIFEIFEAMYPDDFADLTAEIERRGMSWDEYCKYCLEPYYTTLVWHSRPDSALVMGTL